MPLKIYAIILAVLFANTVYSRTGYSDSTVSIQAANNFQLSDKVIIKLQGKYSGLEGEIDKRTQKLLNRMQKQERRLQKLVQSKDSMAAKQLFSTAETKYQAFQNKLKQPVTKVIPRPLQEYIPGLDSLRTSLNFLQKQGSGIGTALNNDQLSSLDKLKDLDNQLQQVQGRMQQAGEIKDFIRQREQELGDRLKQYGLDNKLLGFNKEIYYYQQQLAEYKNILDNQEKLEKTVLSMVRKVPAFETFMQKNSYLGMLFPMPDNYGTPQALNGLQTRASVANLISQRMGTGTNQEQYLQQQVQSADASLSQLKDKAIKTGSSSDMEMPRFTPNTQKTKRFLQRIEYGVNLQSQKSTFILPATTDVAATIGYRFSDAATAGVGISYKVGWGSSLNHIALSNEGVGFRSYADLKMKGSIWITGGCEYNYMQTFAKWSDVADVNRWQKSALLGIEKKYKIGKKSSNMQLLYDFLWKTQIPNAQPFRFRIGYTF